MVGRHAPSTDAATEKQEEASHQVREEQEQGQEPEKFEATPKPAPRVEPAEPLPPRSETPSTHDHRSEDTAPTTPSSVQPSQPSSIAATTPTKATKSAPARPAVPTIPAVPVVPILPKPAPKEAKPAPLAEKTPAESKATTATQVEAKVEAAPAAANGTAEAPSPDAPQPAPAVQPASVSAKPKLWAGLFTKPNSSATPASSTAPRVHEHTNGNAVDESTAAPGVVGGFPKSVAGSLAEALHAYRPGPIDKLPFLEPRGLVNTGNMCYMNSVSASVL